MWIRNRAMLLSVACALLVGLFGCNSAPKSILEVDKIMSMSSEDIVEYVESQNFEYEDDLSWSGDVREKFEGANASVAFSSEGTAIIGDSRSNVGRIEMNEGVSVRGMALELSTESVSMDTQEWFDSVAEASGLGSPIEMLGANPGTEGITGFYKVDIRGEDGICEISASINDGGQAYSKEGQYASIRVFCLSDYCEQLQIESSYESVQKLLSER